MKALRIGVALAALLAIIGGALALLLRDAPEQADGKANTNAVTARSKPKPKPTPKVCDRVASPVGAAHVRGTVAGAATLARGLRPGQTGCLRGGTYVESVTIAGSNITLRSFPGERARIVGRLWVTREARDVTIAHLALDGRNVRNLPSPTVNGSRITFASVDVTNDHTAICFIIGSAQYGRAVGTVIRDSQIHDCGELPARNTNHGIYIAAADDTRIVANVIYRNADRGIQLYPDAQHTTIVGNIIDGNGEGIIFSGVGPVASNDTLVRNNIISNSMIRSNVESFYPPGSPTGTGNLVTRNCLFGGRGERARLEPGGRGFVATDNVYADPAFADPARGNYTVAKSSPCAALLKAGRGPAESGYHAAHD